MATARAANPSNQNNQKPPWTRDLRDVLIRLIDRDHVGSALALVALVILLVVAVRIPTEALGKIPRGVGWLFTQGSALAFFAAASAILSLVCLMLIGLVLRLRRVHRAEMDRMAAAKRRLELKLDKKRPRTYQEEEVPKNGRRDRSVPALAAEDRNVEAEAEVEAEVEPSRKRKR